MDALNLENRLNRVRTGTHRFIIGVDEVGYGAWAGPLVVCAAVTDRKWAHPDVKDSKLLTSKRRKELIRDVLSAHSNVSYYCFHSCDPLEVDKVGVYKARDALVVAAIKECEGLFRGTLAVMDGDTLPPEFQGTSNAICIPKADTLVPAVSAASILAKEYRDSIMHQYAKDFPGYGFDTNVGYGTRKHEQGILKQGMCSIHRKSYKLKKLEKRAKKEAEEECRDA